MQSDDFPNDADPIEGLGEEILPERGLPFENDENDYGGDYSFGQPRDLSPIELENMFSNDASLSPKGSGRQWLETASGMAASEPVLTEADLQPAPFSLREDDYPQTDKLGLDTEETGKKLSGKRITIGLFVYLLIWMLAMVVILFGRVDQNLNDEIIMINCLVIGALGGITAGIYQVGKKYLSRERVLRRMDLIGFGLAPIVGGILGALTFGVVRGGLGVLLAGQPEPKISNPLILYLFASILGLEFNLVLKLFEALLGKFQKNAPGA